MTFTSITNEFHKYRNLENFAKNNSPEDMPTVLKAKAEFLASNKVRNAILTATNTNTIDTGLKRSAILQTVITDFARRLLPLNALSTVFSAVPLQGNNKVSVPYYSLDSGSSNSFDSATGYSSMGNTNSGVREITVGEGATNGDRLYESLAFSSSEIARQPFLKIVELAKLKVDRLAGNIMADILGIVTAANYGAAAITTTRELFDSDDVVDLKEACKLWPEGQRALFLDSLYDASLLKDPSFKHVYASASDRAIRDGQLYPRVFGFDYVENPTIPENGEYLKGFACEKSAILVAFAPVEPTQEVRDAGTTYELFIEPKSGVVLSYRTFGNNVLDTGHHIVESSYGFEKGNGEGLKRICSQ